MAEAPLEGLTEGDLAPRPTGVWGVTKREPKPSLKIKTASAIFWMLKVLAFYLEKQKSFIPKKDF